MKIGDQIWMAEGLRYEGGATDDNGNYYYFHGDKDLKNICPSGWHIPSSEEWKILLMNIDSKYPAEELKSSTGWKKKKYNGSNSLGFNAFPNGYQEMNSPRNTQMGKSYYFQFYTKSLQVNMVIFALI